jgi:predicted nucleic acid-binding protein
MADAEQLRRARHVLATIDLVRVSDRIVEAASTVPPPELRTLDAIHLATAEYLDGDVGTFVTYDDRLAAAAAARGLKVAQPR